MRSVTRGQSSNPGKTPHLLITKEMAQAGFRTVARNILYAFAFVLCLCLGIAIVRTVIVSYRSPQEKPCSPSDLDYITAKDKVLGRFIKALGFETVSRTREDQNYTELGKYRDFILAAYSTVFSSPLVRYEIVNNYSLLIHIQGSDPRLTPYLIAGHLDVVPAMAESWDVPPFKGTLQDGYLYGRGTLDCKNGVMSSLEALEFLIQSGHKPKRSFYLAYGHDEEVYGDYGAGNIAAVLKSRGVRLKFIADEGTVIFDGFFPGVSKPIAVIGISEKGRLDVKLSVNTSGGHASMPPQETNIGILARAVNRIETNQMKSVFGQGPEWSLLESLAPEGNVISRFFYSNLWMFYPFVNFLIPILSPAETAMLRTSMVVTMISGGIKTNVIPSYSEAIILIRYHPANTKEQVLSHIRSTINDDRVAVTVQAHDPASPLSPWGEDSFGYQTLRKSIKQVFPGVGVAPGLMIALTDTKHYLDLTDSVYRFLPSVLEPKDLKGIHGHNERISVVNYEKTINFFYHLMRNADDELIYHPPKTEL